MNDPNWLYEATFTDGATMTFYADTKLLAFDHATTVARDANRTVADVKRLKRSKDMTPGDVKLAGTIRPAPPTAEEWLKAAPVLLAKLKLLRDNFGVLLPVAMAEKFIAEADAVIATVSPGWPHKR